MFIREASKLFADAFEHELDDPAELVQLYAIISTIRLFGGLRTLEGAERVMGQVGAAYSAPNKKLRQFAQIATGVSWTRSARSAAPAATTSG